MEKSRPSPNEAAEAPAAEAKERGSSVTLDGEFGSDLEALVSSHREPLTPPAWD